VCFVCLVDRALTAAINDPRNTLNTRNLLLPLLLRQSVASLAVLILLGRFQIRGTPNFPIDISTGAEYFVAPSSAWLCGSVR